MNYVQLDSIKTLKLLNWTSCVERQNEVCADYDQWAWLRKKRYLFVAQMPTQN